MTGNLSKENNEAAEQYIRYYCDKNNNLDFAVMVKGEWGCGKTHTIKLITDKIRNTNSTNFIYISLHGISTTKQIDQELFRAIHPILGSKSVRIVGRIAKGVLSATTSISLGEDDEIKAKLSLPELTDMEAKINNGILIFDDLERCRIPIPEILGYINSFVEYAKIKTIIIANEDEIHNLEASSTNFEHRYAAIKEKLIGLTIKISPNSQQAIDSFLTKIRDGRTKSFLVDNKDTILKLHKESETHNLRHMQQALWDFERLASVFTESHWNKPDAMRLIMATTIALSFEMRAARVKREDLDAFVPRVLTLMRQRHENAPSAIEETQKRYKEVDITKSPLQADIFRDLLFDGQIRNNDIIEQLKNSPLFEPPSQLPAWRVILEIWSISDDEFNIAINEFERQIKLREFNEPGQIILLLSYRIFLSEVGILRYQKSQIVAQAKAYINDQLKSGRLRPAYDGGRIPNFGSWGGFAFPCNNTQEFNEIISEYNTALKRFTKKCTPEKGRQLLTLLASDTVSFSHALTYNETGLDRSFWDEPILHTISPTLFVRQLLKLAPRAQELALNTLKERYIGNRLEKDFPEEKDWLQKVYTILQARLPNLKPVARFRLDNHIKNKIEHLIPTIPDSSNLERLSPA